MERLGFDPRRLQDLYWLVSINIGQAFEPESPYRRRFETLYGYCAKMPNFLTEIRLHSELLKNMGDQPVPQIPHLMTREEDEVDFIDEPTRVVGILREASWRIAFGLGTAQIYETIAPQEPQETLETITPRQVVDTAADKIAGILNEQKAILAEHFVAFPVETHPNKDRILECRESLQLEVDEAITATEEFQDDFAAIPDPVEIHDAQQLARLHQFITHATFLEVFRKVVASIPDDDPLRIARDRFVVMYDITHDTRQPLSGLRGFAEWLARFIKDKDSEGAALLIELYRDIDVAIHDDLNFMMENQVVLAFGGFAEILKDIAPEAEPLPEEVSPESLIESRVETIISILTGYRARINKHFSPPPISLNVEQQFMLNRIRYCLDKTLGVMKTIWGVFTGNFHPEPQPVAFLDIIESERETISSDLTVMIDNQSGHQTVNVDPFLFGRVWGNLLQNLERYGEKMGVLTIKLVHRGKRQFVHFALKDQGMGIKAEELPHIFKRHYRTAAAIARREEGMGVGLNASAKIVKSWGGKMKVESKGIGMGSTFSFTIPIEESPTKDPATVSS